MLLLFFANFLLIADPRPHQNLDEEGLFWVAAFNSLTESQQSFRELGTTANLRKYNFSHSDASLLQNS